MIQEHSPKSPDSVPYNRPLFSPRLAYRLTCLCTLAVFVQSFCHGFTRIDSKLPAGCMAVWLSLIAAGCIGFAVGVQHIIYLNKSGGTEGRNYALAATGVGPAAVVVSICAFPYIEREAAHYLAMWNGPHCVSNVKQISRAALMYAQDYDDHLPEGHSWMSTLHAYIHNDSYYYCPQSRYAYGEAQLTYALLQPLSGVEIGNVESPHANTVFFFDSVKGENLTGGIALLPKPSRHDGRQVIGFLDGHVKQVRTEDAGGLTWSPKLNLDQQADTKQSEKKSK